MNKKEQKKNKVYIEDGVTFNSKYSYLTYLAVKQEHNKEAELDGRYELYKLQQKGPKEAKDIREEDLLEDFEKSSREFFSKGQQFKNNELPKLGGRHQYRIGRECNQIRKMGLPLHIENSYDFYGFPRSDIFVTRVHSLGVQFVFTRPFKNDEVYNKYEQGRMYFEKNKAGKQTSWDLWKQHSGMSDIDLKYFKIQGKLTISILKLITDVMIHTTEDLAEMYQHVYGHQYKTDEYTLKQYYPKGFPGLDRLYDKIIMYMDRPSSVVFFKGRKQAAQRSYLLKTIQFMKDGQSDMAFQKVEPEAFSINGLELLNDLISIIPAIRDQIHFLRNLYPKESLHRVLMLYLICNGMTSSLRGEFDKEGIYKIRKPMAETVLFEYGSNLKKVHTNSDN